jgi:hypothetical protein
LSKFGRFQVASLHVEMEIVLDLSWTAEFGITTVVLEVLDHFPASTIFECINIFLKKKISGTAQKFQ